MLTLPVFAKKWRDLAALVKRDAVRETAFVCLLVLVGALFTWGVGHKLYCEHDPRNCPAQHQQ